MFDRLIPGLAEAKRRAAAKEEHQNALDYLSPISIPVKIDNMGYVIDINPGQLIAKIDSVNHIAVFPFNGQGPYGTSFTEPKDGKFFLAKPMPGGFGLINEQVLDMHYFHNSRSMVGPNSEVFAIYDQDFINRVNRALQEV